MDDRRFELLTAETMTDEQRSLAEAILSGPRARDRGLLTSPLGEVGGPFNALLRSPELGDCVQRLGACVRFRSSFDPALNELAILLTARRWTAQFEWYAHHRMALDAGLDPGIAAEIAAGVRPTSLDAEQTVVYDFVSELLATGGVSDAAFAHVVEIFGERGAVDLIGVVGHYTLVSFILNVDRHPLPEGVAPPLQAL